MHGEIEQTRYGLDHRAVLEVLGQPPESIEKLITVVQELQPNLSEIVQEPDSVSGCSGEWKTLGNLTRSLMRREATQNTYENLEAMPANLLIHILSIWAGEPGALRINKEQISVTVRDERHGNILRSFGFVVLLDATPNKRLLAERIGVAPDSIIEIEQELPALDNLEVVNVYMEGMGSGDWSKRCLERLQALTKTLKQRHLELPLLGNKRYAEALKLEGWWFNHNRGSNEFKGKKAIAAFGSPYVHVGAAQDEYLALFGNLDSFDEYYQQLVKAEIIQLIGRQRSHLYPDEQFKLYLVGTNQDLSFLSVRFAIQVTQQEAFEICPEAGTKTQAGRWAILKAVSEAIATGKKLAQISTTEVAHAVGLTQGRISQLVKALGGWREFKKLLVPLCNPCREFNNFSTQVEDGWLRVIFNLPPLEAVKEAVEIVKAVGVDELQNLASFETRVRLVGMLLSLLPRQVLKELETLP